MQESFALYAKKRKGLQKLAREFLGRLNGNAADVESRCMEITQILIIGSIINRFLRLVSIFLKSI